MIYYKEEQRFRQWWLMAIIGLSAVSMLIIFSYGFYQQFYLGEPWGDEPMSDRMLLLVGTFTMVFTFFICWGVLFAKLETKIKQKTIYYRFIPFVWSWKKIRLNELDHFEVRKYKPVAEYGGWGYRYSFNKGKALNVSGNMGLQLILKNGKKVLLGTQKPKELKKVMQQMVDIKQEDHG